MAFLVIQTLFESELTIVVERLFNHKGHQEISHKEHKKILFII